MMGPHWNPSETEISVVLDGEGMIQVVCPSKLTNKECKNTRVRVEEGDVFTVPRFHPTAQMSFNNGSLVYLGFSTTTSKKNRPQFLAGKASILQTLDVEILGISFNVSNTTVAQLLAAQNKSILLDCTSCAEMMMERPEEEERKTEEEKEEERHREDERERREEERREGEEEKRRRKEEEQHEGGGGESESTQQEEERRREDERERREEETEGGEEEFEEEMEESQQGEEEGEGQRWKNSNRMKINKQDKGSYWRRTEKE